MDWTSPFFLLLILLGPTYILSGWIMLKWPPKNMNGTYGYRTKRSRSSQEAWDFAQEHSSYEFIKLGIITMMVALLGLVIHMQDMVGLVLASIITILSVILTILRTENALKTNFNEDQK